MESSVSEERRYCCMCTLVNYKFMYEVNGRDLGLFHKIPTDGRYKVEA